MFCLRLWCYFLWGLSLTSFQTYSYDFSGGCECDDDVPECSSYYFTPGDTPSDDDDDFDQTCDEDVSGCAISGYTLPESCHSDQSDCYDEDDISNTEDQSWSTKDWPRSGEDTHESTEDQTGTSEDQSDVEEEVEEDPLPFHCTKDNGVEPPDNLLQITTTLLEERDVTHYLKWDGMFWKLGSGTFADVHLGRYMPTGECVVVKRFTDSSINRIEREIRIHRYIEEALPNTPRIIGILPTGHEVSNASLVFEVVPEGITLHHWLKRKESLYPVQWLSVSLQLMEALDRLHRKCILHNDLHPKNVLVYFNDAGRHSADCSLSRLTKPERLAEARVGLSMAKVTPTTLPRLSFIDFGFATFREGKVFSGDTKYLESCEFLAPEVKRHHSTTAAADVFTAGYTLEYIANAFNSSGLRDIALLCQEQDPEFRPSVRWVADSIRRLFHQEYRRAVLQPTSSASGNGRYAPVEQLSAITHRHSSSDELSDPSSSICPLPSDDDDTTSTLPALTRTRVKNRASVNDRLSCTSPPCLPTSRRATAAWKIGTSRCIPELFEDAVSELQLPYIPRTGDLNYKDDEGMRNLFHRSRFTEIYTGHFESTGVRVAIKTVEETTIFRIRYEATMNLLLNDSGWVPRFYGVLPVDRYDLHGLGIVQEFFAEGVTLSEVLGDGRPVGAMPRARLALQLTSFIHDVHSRYMLINSVTAQNLLCACVNDSHCDDIRVIDVGSAGGCEGISYEMDLSDPYFSYIAPEVRQKRMTSFASDVFSMCAILDSVLDREAMLKNETEEVSIMKVQRLLSQWESMSRECYSEDPNLRPSAFRLKHLFNTFVNFR